MRNYIVDRLENYFANNYTLNRVPLLIGPSGVAKSALVKESAKNHNMRLVDIRTAFMSRLDIEGLSEKIEIDGKFYSEPSPMFDFIKCTDEYLEVAKKCAEIINDELTICEDHQKEYLTYVRDKFLEEAKTPILIFDEITRGEPSVRQVLTKILTDKEFMGLSMKRARVVAATNSQLDESGEIVDIYAVNEAYDVAFYDRFESMYVSPAVMNKTWLEWAENNLDPTVIEEIKASTCYDTSHFIDKDYRQAITTPYKCYRTWEMLSNFYKANTICRFPIDIVRPFRSSIVGGIARMPMAEFITTAISTNTPALVISPSGMGKTARVNAICKKQDCEMITINLAEVDRLDIEGMPVKVRTIKAMAGSVKVTRNIAERIKTVFENSKLPEHCTIRAPKKEYVDKFKKALDTGRKVVIYFDECNRVQNVSVMSAIFSVISDNRLFGVSFDPKQVTTILSCNLSDNCADAQDLDPALCARFAIWEAKEYTRQDASNFLKYATRKQFHPIVLDYLRSQTLAHLIENLKSVETRTMEISASSSRGWEDLSTTLKSIKDGLLTGSIIFASEESKKKLSVMKRTGAGVDEIIEHIKMKIRFWAGHKLTENDTLESGKSGKKEVIRLMLLLGKVEILSENEKREFILDLFKVDIEISDYRENFFRIFLGGNTQDFTDFYNQNAGEESLQISLNKDMIPKEVSEVVNTICMTFSGDKLNKEIQRLLESVIRMEFKTPEKVLTLIWRELSESVKKREVIESLSDTYDGLEVLKLFEKDDFYKRIASEIGLEIIDDYKPKVL